MTKKQNTHTLSKMCDTNNCFDIEKQPPVIEESHIKTETCSLDLLKHGIVSNEITKYISSSYVRKKKNDNIIKNISYLIILSDILILIFLVVQMKKNFSNIYFLVNFLSVLFFFMVFFFSIHYKLYNVVIGVYKLFLKPKKFLSNNKYYSGIEIPDLLLIHKRFPNITIQVPIYKENLENTIVPTLLSAKKQAERYTKETNAFCNIVVCDDGLNIIQEEEKEKRMLFYKEHNIGFIARPHPSKHERKGRFKKASNLNFAMNFSKIIMGLQETPLLKQAFTNALELGALYNGNVIFEKYIFLIDSDTRFPEFSLKKNGCLKRLLKDAMHDGENVLFSQCFTGPYMSTNSLSEKCIYNYTCNIYNGILIGTSLHCMAPFVGHNALINHDLLEDIAEENPTNGFKYYWSENKISEDFDCMIRGCKKGYIGRYVASSGIFLEGISFDYLTEYFKLSKFACGAAELTFNPMSSWFVKNEGIFSKNMKDFIWCEEIEWYNKLNIVSYIVNFFSIAQSHFALLYNLFFFESLVQILPFYLTPVNLMFENLFIWCLLTTFFNILYSKKINFNFYIVLKQQLREICFTSCLYGSLSVKFSIMYFIHLFHLNISFGATQKDDKKIKAYEWFYSTKYEFIIYNVYLVFILVRIFVFPVKSCFHTFYFGTLPLLINIFWYYFGILYDVSFFKEKTTHKKIYFKETTMFEDKYNTLIPKINIFENQV